MRPPLRLVTRIALVASCTAALSACGALIGIKSLTAPDDDGTDGAASDGIASDGGADGTLDAPGEGVADSGCGDLLSTADHCGRCGHSCLGGACEAGLCQPTAIATGQGEVSGVALDSTYVYFASFTSDVVARVPKAGGAVAAIATSGVSLTRHVAVDATHVYWSAGDSPGTVARCLLTGCVGSPEVLANPDRPMGIALDPAFVYWADRNDSALQRKPLTGGAQQHVADAVGLPVAVAVGGSQLFWVDDFDGTVGRKDLVGGGGGTVGVNGTSGVDVIVDGAYVYWAAAIDVGEMGRISRAPSSGTGPTTLLGPAQGEPVALATDDALVYWTAWDRLSDGGVAGAGVYACAKSGCGAAPTSVATNQALPRGIAVDANAIYWGADGTVMKLAKP